MMILIKCFFLGESCSAEKLEILSVYHHICTLREGMFIHFCSLKIFLTRLHVA